MISKRSFHRSKSFHNNRNTQFKVSIQEALEKLGTKLQIKRLEDWYKVTGVTHKLIDYHYDGSLPKCLIDCYPNHNWQIWKFSEIPREYFELKDYQKKTLDWF